MTGQVGAFQSARAVFQTERKPLSTALTGRPRAVVPVLTVAATDTSISPERVPTNNVQVIYKIEVITEIKIRGIKPLASKVSFVIKALERSIVRRLQERKLSKTGIHLDQVIQSIFANTNGLLSRCLPTREHGAFTFSMFINIYLASTFHEVLPYCNYKQGKVSGFSTLCLSGTSATQAKHRHLPPRQVSHYRDVASTMRPIDRTVQLQEKKLRRTNGNITMRPIDRTVQLQEKKLRRTNGNITMQSTFSLHYIGTKHLSISLFRIPAVNRNRRLLRLLTSLSNSSIATSPPNGVQSPKKIAPALCRALGKIVLEGLSNQCKKTEMVFPKSRLTAEINGESTLKNHDRDKLVADLLQKKILKEHDSTSLSFIRSGDRDSFAAYLLSKYPDTDLETFILKHRNYLQFNGVFALLGGLLWETCQEDFPKNVETMKKRFFDPLFLPSDLMPTYQVKLLLHCLKSCHSEQLENALWEAYDIKNTLVRMMRALGSSFHQSFSTYIGASIKVHRLAFQKLDGYFDGTDPKVKKGAGWMLSALAEHVKGEDVTRLLNLIEKGLLDQKVRKGAQRAVHRLAEHTKEEDFAKVLTWVTKHLQGKKAHKAAMTTVPVLAKRMGIDQLFTRRLKTRLFLPKFLTWVAHNTQEEDGLISLKSLLQLEKGHVIPQVFSWIREQLKKSEAQSLGLSLFKHAIASVPEVHFAAALSLVSQVVDIEKAESKHFEGVFVMLAERAQKGKERSQLIQFLKKTINLPDHWLRKEAIHALPSLVERSQQKEGHFPLIKEALCQGPCRGRAAKALVQLDKKYHHKTLTGDHKEARIALLKCYSSKGISITMTPTPDKEKYLLSLGANTPHEYSSTISKEQYTTLTNNLETIKKEWEQL